MTHIARFASWSQSCEGDFGEYRAYPGSRPLRCISNSPSNRPWLRRPMIRADSGLLFVRITLGKKRETARFAGQPENIPTSPYDSGRFGTKMEHAKLANGSGHKSIGHSSTSVPRKAARKKAEPARPLRKELRSKSKSEKLVCRYCGSDDLAPSFIKRRDRRCRKCFSKRYGSAARAKKAKTKK